MIFPKHFFSFWDRWGLLGRLLLPVGITVLIGIGVQAFLGLQSSIEDQQRRHQRVIDETIEILSPLIVEQAITGDYASINQLLISQVEKRQVLQKLVWLDGEGGAVTANGTTKKAKAPDWFMSLIALPELSVSHAVELSGSSYGKIEVTINTIPAANKIWSQYLQHTINIVLVMLTVFVVISFILRVNLKTLHQLSLAADQFRRGDYTVRIKPDGARELQTAVEAFNNMANRNEQLLYQLTTSKQELHEQLNFNMELFDAIPIPVFYKDKDGRYLGVNRAWEDFFGKTEEEIVGRTLFDLYPRTIATADQHYAADLKLLEGLNKQRYEIILPGLPKGDRHTIFSKALYTNTDGAISGIIGAITDLTDAKCSEQKAQSAMLDKYTAEAASNTKSAFLANMSHEIRTPLTSIIGFSESLLDSDSSMQDRVESIGTIIRSGKHLLKIINDILDLSKIEANKLDISASNFPIIEILSDVQALVGLLAEGKSIAFKVGYNWPLPQNVCSDQLRLKQILINLCNNAIKFTSNGSVDLRVGYDADINKLRFDIIDTGIGLTPEQMDKLFSPFMQADVTTTRQYGGTGLGLYLSRLLAKCLGGDITVESTPGKGSCFTLVIDAGDVEGEILLHSPPEVTIAPKLSPKQEDIYAVHGKVLLAEDNLDNQVLISRYLSKQGAQVSIADNGEIAVQQAMQGGYDLILIDMQMPVMDGPTATRSLRAQGYTGPIVALTANAMQEDVDKCLAAGCNDFLSKPVDRIRFQAVIRHYLEIANEQQRPICLFSLLLEEGPEFNDLVLTFIERLPEVISKVEEANASNDWTLLRKLLHDLKSISGGYGYPQMSETAARMEFELAKNDHKGIAVRIKELNRFAEQIYAGGKLLIAECIREN
jgi:PAS domain S-box-containing protein